MERVADLFHESAQEEGAGEGEVPLILHWALYVVLKPIAQPEPPQLLLWMEVEVNIASYNLTTAWKEAL